MNQAMIISICFSAFRFIIRGMFISFFRKIIKLIGGFMLKLVLMGIFASSLSTLTGVPVFPVQPVIAGQSLHFVPAEVDQRKLEGFKQYIHSKFN